MESTSGFNGIHKLVRYIHLNPLRAKIVVDLKELNSYPYCGHSVLMGRQIRGWQDTEYVLGLFGKRLGEARKIYISYVKKGIALGRRPELVGGGLIRSLGGWDEVKKMRLSGQDRIKSDQRILGDSDFVRGVLSESEAQFSHKYKLKRLGYDFDKVIDRVCNIFQMEHDFVIGRGKQRDRVRARDLLCYWAVIDLGMTMVDVARRLGITPAAVSYSVQRGEKMAKEDDYQLELLKL
jgi:putative transposase